MSGTALTLAPVTSSVSAARAFLKRTLRTWAVEEPAWEQLQWPAAQALSELATNAVLHAATDFTVALLADGERLRMEVADRSPEVPHQRRYGLHATTGRGLALLGALCVEWGVEPATGGKVVWCLLDVRRAGPGLVDRPTDDPLDAFLSEEDRRGLGAT